MLGDTLKELREEKNITQAEIAKIISVERQTYGGYERNTSLPDADAIKKLAQYYGVTADYLLQTNIRPKSLDDYTTTTLNRLSKENLEKVLDYANYLQWQQNKKTSET